MLFKEKHQHKSKQEKVTKN